MEKEEGLKNDIIIALISFMVGGLLTWLGYLTLQVVSVQQDVAVDKVVMEQLKDQMESLKQDARETPKD